jgi:hypothetical protein
LEQYCHGFGRFAVCVIVQLTDESRSLPTFTEHDHIGLPSTAVSFPTVAIINASSIAVKQSADLFKLGVNYKFEFGP